MVCTWYVNMLPLVEVLPSVSFVFNVLPCCGIRFSFVLAGINLPSLIVYTSYFFFFQQEET